MKKGFLLALTKSDAPGLSYPIIEENENEKKRIINTEIKPKPNRIVPKLILKRGEKLLCEDYSNGLEDMPISVVNGVDQEDIPKIDYQPSRYSDIPRIGLELAKSKEICSSCTCIDDCSDPKKCKCQIKTEDRYYELKQFNNTTKNEYIYYNNGKLESKIFGGIYECNRNCKCNDECKNRVTQSRLNIPLQIFKTKEIGWGVRTNVDIPKGTFISVYSGKLMTDAMVLKSRLENRGKYPDEYIVYLSDIVTAVNSTQNVPELCWDYGYEPGAIPDREMVCKCGASNCRGRLL